MLAAQCAAHEISLLSRNSSVPENSNRSEVPELTLSDPDLWDLIKPVPINPSIS